MVRQRSQGIGHDRSLLDLQPDRQRRRGRHDLPRHPRGDRGRSDPGACPRGRDVRAGLRGGAARRTLRGGVRHARRTLRHHRTGHHDRDRRAGRDVGRRWGDTARSTATLATTWHVVQAPAEPTPEALVIYNRDNAAGTLTVSAIGPRSGARAGAHRHRPARARRGAGARPHRPAGARPRTDRRVRQPDLRRRLPSGGDLRYGAGAVGRRTTRAVPGRTGPDHLLVAVAIVVVALGVAADRQPPPARTRRRNRATQFPYSSTGPTSASRRRRGSSPCSRRRVVSTCADVSGRASARWIKATTSPSTVVAFQSAPCFIHQRYRSTACRGCGLRPRRRRAGELPQAGDGDRSLGGRRRGPPAGIDRPGRRPDRHQHPIS